MAFSASSSAATARSAHRDSALRAPSKPILPSKFAALCTRRPPVSCALPKMAATAVDKELDTAAAAELLLRPDAFGRFGRFGGKYVPETLMAALTELEAAFKSLATDHEFQVASIDVKEETPVDHGEVICFGIYSGAKADFGDGKSCIWVDVLDGGGKDLIKEFAPFFEDPSIKKGWHNYSFDSHVLENYGIKLSGFYADTMHMARLWNSSRRTEGGYSLEALTRDPNVMSDAKKSPGEEVLGKVSMKTIFGKKKLNKDGSKGKIVVIPPVEELQ